MLITNQLIKDIEVLNEKILSLNSIEDRLAYLCAQYPNQVTFSSSLSYEDQVVTDYIFKNQLDIKVFTLDTGRLFYETYSTLARTNEFYNSNIQVYFPNYDNVEKMVNQKGPNSFFESVENRKECCRIRKVEPLKRALAGNKVWITGIRAEQSDNRANMTMLEWDAGNEIIKFHPIMNWSFEEVKAFIHQKGIPYNTLHDKGFVSIGCAPCTRAIRAGEDFRAGRWFWEQADKKECGLHHS